MVDSGLAKEATEVRKAKYLLEMKAKLQGKYDPASLAQKAGVKAQLALISDKHIRSAKAELRGEEGPSLKELAGKATSTNTNTAERDKEWRETLVWVRAQTKNWAEPAIERELQIQISFVDYSTAMTPLIEAFESAKSLKVPTVKGKAGTVEKQLQTAQGSLQDYSKLLNKRLEELENFTKLIDFLEQSGEPPGTLDEVRKARSEHQNTIQALKSAEQKSKDQIAKINKQCTDSQKDIEAAIKLMVTSVVAWRKTEDIRTGCEWAEASLNGIVNVVQVANSEPMSAAGVQGVHMLIKGVCDGVKVLAAAFKQHELAKLKVDDVVGKLREEDFIVAKVDGVKIAISWAAEPLGFIPNVGPLVRTIINAVTEAVSGTLKKAAKKQGDAIRAKKNPPTKKEEFKEEIDAAKETIMLTAQTVIEENLKAVKDIGELMKHAKDVGEHAKEAAHGAMSPEAAVAALATKLALALVGPAMETALAEIIPALGMVSPEAIQATLNQTRSSIDTLTHQNLEFQSIKLDFAFDEGHAKGINVDVLDKLAEGQSCQVLVASSSELKSTAGVALLIGDGHAKDNRSFVDTLINSGSGFTGDVTMKAKGRFGELEFRFADSKAKELVKEYVASYGSGGGRITRKDLTFA
jgi:hypothetical protein